MTPSARKELEKTLEYVLSKWPVDVPCEPPSEYLDGYTMALHTVKEHIARRLKAAKRSKK